MPAIALSVSLKSIAVLGNGVGENNFAVAALGSELDGFALDFLTDAYALRTTTANEKLLIQLGNEWDGMALDFTSDLFATRISNGAERLLGTGPDTQEPFILGVDFTDNSLALRN